MNQQINTGLGNIEIQNLLKFNTQLKSGLLSSCMKDIGIDLYCNLLCAMHPECNVTPKKRPVEEQKTIKNFAMSKAR